ncbi:MAG: hypothetical protein PHH93_11075, partial [Prolixibacteraceae bacterium]|nr:hypothetical protein [Prolixibacteraceae bacterium]
GSPLHNLLFYTQLIYYTTVVSRYQPFYFCFSLGFWGWGFLGGLRAYGFGGMGFKRVGKGLGFLALCFSVTLCIKGDVWLKPALKSI